MNDYSQEDKWGLKSKMEKIENELISLEKAKFSATGKNLEIIEGKIANIKEANKDLENIAIARIQLHVLKKRMDCDKYKKFWPKYKNKCKDLKKMALWK